jgi:hypothetical protein
MRRSRQRTLRWLAGYVAVMSALPYLALKLVWLGGGTLGVADPAMMRETSMVVLNAITAGMDVVAIFLALAFTHDWGSRVPPWLVLPPMWVASGLLATFVVAVPVTAILSALTSESPPVVTGGPVERWVYVLVYLEFAGLGVGLLTAFLLHARARWAAVFQPASHIVRQAATHPLQVVLANAGAPIAIALGVLSLAWAVGATVGLPPGAAGHRTVFGAVFNGTDAVLAIAAAAGVLMMVHRMRETLPGWVSVAMAWTGTGSLFGWGLWRTINVLGETALMGGLEGTGFLNLVGLLRLVVGLVLGMLMQIILTERCAASRTSVAVDKPV